MVGAFDEVVTQGVRRKHTVHDVLNGLCKAEASERKARSMRYQMSIAKFPVLKDLDTFDFGNVPVEEMIIKELYQGLFLSENRSILLSGDQTAGYFQTLWF